MTCSTDSIMQFILGNKDEKHIPIISSPAIYEALGDSQTLTRWMMGIGVQAMGMHCEQYSTIRQYPTSTRPH